MAKQTVTSNLLSRLGARGEAAFQKAKGAETTLPNAGLPAGIEGGIARLDSIKFGVYKDGDFKDQLYYMAAGTMLKPVTHEGMRIQGLRTQIGPIPLCDKPKSQSKTMKTMEDAIGFVCNELRKLSANTKTLPNINTMEAVAAALEKQKPYFTVRTWKGQKQTTGPYANKEPRVTQEWCGVIKDYKETPEDEVNEQPTTPDEVDLQQATPDEPAESQEDTGADGSEGGDEIDLDALVASASQDNEEEDTVAAREQLTSMAAELGYDANQIETWEEVKGYIEAGEPNPEASGDEATAEDPYAVTKLWGYKPVVGGKKAAKHIECEIIAVQPDKGTVHLKNLETGKPINGGNKKPLPVKTSDLIKL